MSVRAPSLPPRAHAPESVQIVPGEARWPAMAAILAVGTLHLALPDTMNVGPPWLLLVVVGVLLVPTVVAHRTGRHDVNAWLGHGVQVLITAALAWSLARLIAGLSTRATPAAPPAALLRAAAALWVTNVLVFASWYWRLDAGGPNVRDQRRRAGAAHTRGAFLFPQMMLPGMTLPGMPPPGMPLPGDAPGSAGPPHPHAHAHPHAHGPAQPAWRPEFVDYLFLAFCTSTAFSPTDTPVLSRWAKLLTMVQATISFVAVAVLAARAVNIL